MSRRAMWVVPVGEIGGVARHALDVAGVGIPGWQLTFVVPPGPLAAALGDKGAHVEVLPIGPRRGLRSSVISLRTLLKQQQPQVMHTHLAYADILGAIVKPGSGTSLVTTEHGIADNDLIYHGVGIRSAIAARYHQLRLRRTDYFIAVSHKTLAVAIDKWHRPGSMPHRVIRNGVDPQPRDQAESGLHVVSLARFAPEKRLDALVTAFAELAAQHPQARLTLAGTGPLLEQIRAQVVAANLSDRVSLPGFVDAVELLQTAQVLAQLSVFENCSYSLLDAVARGVGVVASPVGGNPEILPEHCLVDPADPHHVADVINTQATDLAARPVLPEGWPTVVEMATQIGAVYDEVTP